jgi:ubiquitin carboxyl-terminal hydrolase 34
MNTKIELADWFVENKIIEHLFGPNLHVEVIKRSQDIMNFLAFTNRLTDKHLDVIWTSAQVSLNLLICNNFKRN